jgi:hypothetical protein
MGVTQSDIGGITLRQFGFHGGLRHVASVAASWRLETFLCPILGGQKLRTARVPNRLHEGSHTEARDWSPIWRARHCHHPFSHQKAGSPQRVDSATVAVAESVSTPSIDILPYPNHLQSTCRHRIVAKPAGILGHQETPGSSFYRPSE